MSIQGAKAMKAIEKLNTVAMKKDIDGKKKVVTVPQVRTKLLINGKDKWITDARVVYKVDDEDLAMLETKPEPMILTDATKQKSFGFVNPSDTVEETGIKINMHLENAKIVANLMLHRSGNNLSVFLVNEELMTKIRSTKKGATYKVGVRADKRIIHNEEETISILGLDDEIVSTVLDSYKDVFTALSVMYKMDAISLVK